MGVNFIEKELADDFLSDLKFIDEWKTLLESCPWATSFQGPDFVVTWYKCYQDYYDPILLVSKNDKGKLIGLLSLAKSSKDSSIVIAGGRQAEYQTWICSVETSADFPNQALKALRREIPSASLAFFYLPPNTPTDWVANSDFEKIVHLDTLSRPLLSLSRSGKNPLKKKSNKSKLNRLEKIGRVSLRRITSVAELEPIFDKMIEFYDLRQGAKHGGMPFSEDGIKRIFHAAIAAVEGLLHITVLTVGDNIASVFLGAISGKEVQLGIIAHNPFLSKFSPGKIHILMLSELLLDEGFETLDLTPGGDSYKERFSNGHDNVQTMTVYASALERKKKTIFNAIANQSKIVLKKLNIQPGELKNLVSKLSKMGSRLAWITKLQQGRDWIRSDREMRIYYYEADKAKKLVPAKEINRDCLKDLINYQPPESWQSRQRFLSTGLNRLENGTHFYSYSENGQTMHYGWLIEQQEEFFIGEVRSTYCLPKNSAVLCDLYSAPSARKELYYKSLNTLLYDASHIPDCERIYISVLADNRPSRHIIEKVGFIYEASMFEKIRLGKAYRWKS